MGNGIIKVCARCGKPTKKQFRTVCKACGHDRWAPPTAHEQLALAYAKSNSAAGRSQVAPAEEGSDLVTAYDLADDSSDSESEIVEAAFATHSSTDSHAASSAGANVVRQTPQLDLARLNISSAFLNANAEEAIKSPRPFGRPNASRLDTTDSSECSRVRIGPRRGAATRNLREMQLILRKESPGRSGTMPSESRSNRHRHVGRESKNESSKEDLEERGAPDTMVK